MMRERIEELSRLIRSLILTSTTAAGSGHPTSSLSAVELMATLFFGGYLRYDLHQPDLFENDRVIFSKGHASPLLYALYAAAGAFEESELLKLRTFDSVLEGHPSMRFAYTEASTGSLGQGLSVGFGIAMSLKSQIEEAADCPRVFVLLGDSEVAEGQVWEAAELASFYKLNNLVAVLDVNRLGQRGQTMLGRQTDVYASRFEAFGWHVVMVADGHDVEKVIYAYNHALSVHDKPVVIIASTVKGKGVSFIEDRDGWHGKTLNQEELREALAELGDIDADLRGEIKKPDEKVKRQNSKVKSTSENTKVVYEKGKLVATREAYGDALVELGNIHADLVVLDGEVSNSTMADKFGKEFPERFFEMFIAEQNMISAGVGFAKMGHVPFISSFAAFLTRGFDQVRMAQYSSANIKLCGSHAGVFIGADGPSQMGLEDLSMMRSIRESVVLYPSDAVSAAALTRRMYEHTGVSYIRTTREKLPVLYEDTDFKIGGCRVWNEDEKSVAVIIAAGITLHEALRAAEKLKAKNISVAVIDSYSIKPLDTDTIIRLAEKCGHVVTVEDHYMYGGLGEAVNSALKGLHVKIINKAVTKMPRSGKPEELLSYEEIDSKAILKAVEQLL